MVFKRRSASRLRFDPSNSPGRNAQLMAGDRDCSLGIYGDQQQFAERSDLRFET